MTGSVVLLAALAGLLTAYAVGVRRLSPPARRSWTIGACRRGAWRVAAFVLGLASVAGALVGPMDELADGSFAWHMVEHMILILVSAPLLAAGAAGVPLLLALPRSWRPPVTRMRHAFVTSPPLRPLRLPVTAFLVQVGTLGLWHLPALYDAALRSEPVHVTEHLTLLLSSCWFWWFLLAPTRLRLVGGVAVLYVFIDAAPGTLLGALLTLAQHPLYPFQAAQVQAARGNPLTDQQLAGLAMWVPAGVVYLLAALALFLPWFGSIGAVDGKGRGAYAVPEPVLTAPGEVVR
jgi:cytochrome c oxidase assembly factor CtaG